LNTREQQTSPLSSSFSASLTLRWASPFLLIFNSPTISLPKWWPPTVLQIAHGTFVSYRPVQVSAIMWRCIQPNWREFSGDVL
jgi:hypothetical protein